MIARTYRERWSLARLRSDITSTRSGASKTPAAPPWSCIRSSKNRFKALLAGADVVQLVSALLRHGVSHIATMREGLARWMSSHDIDRLDDARGRVSLHAIGDGELFERAHYIRTLQSWTA